MSVREADVRLARADELPAVLGLLAGARLPDAGLGEHLASLLVASDGGRVVGSAALEIDGGAALLRSVAVASERRGRGVGRALTRAALDLAQDRGARVVYLLTETAAGFFEGFGFRQVPRADAEPAVGRSVEFTTACPVTATCMRLDLPAPAGSPSRTGGGRTGG